MSSAEPRQFPSAHGLVWVPMQNYLVGKALKSHPCLSSSFKILKLGRKILTADKTQKWECFVYQVGLRHPLNWCRNSCLPSTHSVLELSLPVNRHLLMPANSAARKAIFSLLLRPPFHRLWQKRCLLSPSMSCQEKAFCPPTTEAVAEQEVVEH